MAAADLALHVGVRCDGGVRIFMKEIWKPVVGFEGSYEVSDRGRVRSVNRIVLTTRGPRSCRGRLLAAYRNVHRGGYRYANLRSSGKQKMCRVACLVARTFIGSRPIGSEVCHKNGKAHDDRAANLRYGTKAENIRDKERHGTIYRGQRHPAAKLTAAQVRRIRRLHNEVPKVVLAQRYGVHVGHISNVQNNRRWNHHA